ncbi:raffinose/stachyose/melibiose transport system substrate-binding protein [Streptosporangium becharense]|uniref:Raffinose/stachyose/melibiose transport system substrate-binding protein n=1 Tax=Streptosporangium becharense TaxID=1816182 RepID=A0A7W9IKU0_9ACTN|nr:extracellular solute-binding protein [Streptosporangium becharense]MBB2911597.1 raffinose/stachyose/melibiose transport system substrate-binding protein [Streptosporangium becharense]MBB5822585.1 raffinose/stachyose/melibiose transport system substrate-binding protein [Streptosporangium becharense]
MRRWRCVAALTASALLLGACGTDGEDAGAKPGASGGTEKVTFEFWHSATAEPLKSFWADLVKRYQAAHPNVTIKNVGIENDSYKPKLATLTQSGRAPDLYSTWGGGVLKQHVDAGLVKDLTAETADIAGDFTPASLVPYRFDGKLYALPTDIGMVGFWYNKALFARAGVTTPPATWTEFLDTVRKLKAAGITPIALAGKAKWPGHYYWAYLAMRVAGLDALRQAGETGDFTGPGFVAAGQRLKELVDLQPFQKGFLGADYSTPDGQAATMSNGRAAMELMGQWAPAVQKDAGKGLGEDLGFFTFPTVEGGKGVATDAFGGGGGLAVGADAPPAALDFLKFALKEENHRKAVEAGGVLPVLKGEESAVTDPGIKAVSETLSAATAFQLYLDQAYPPAVGQEVNDAVAELIAGEKTPEEVASAITETAKSEAE